VDAHRSFLLVAAVLLASGVVAFFEVPEPIRSDLVLPICVTGAIACAVAGLIAALYRR
jgi:hypothetical protein